MEKVSKKIRSNKGMAAGKQAHVAPGSLSKHLSFYSELDRKP